MHLTRLGWPSLSLLVALSGCVPTFDRCRIPGTEGCPEPSDGAVVDGSTSDGAAADAAAACAAEPTIAPLFETDFEDVSIDDFTITGDSAADWAIESGELVQRAASARGAQAVVGAVAEPDVRVIARMRRIGGSASGAMELAVRASATDAYHCNWEPSNGTFEIQRSSQPLALSATTVDLASVPEYDPAMTVTMDLSVTGSMLRCCLREIPVSLTVFDDALDSGSPGVRTFELSAAFDDLATYPAM